MWHSSHRAGSSGFGRNVFTPAIALTRTGRLPAIHVIISTSWQHFSNSDPPLVFLKRRQSLRNMTDVVITWGNSSAWMLTTSPKIIQLDEHHAIAGFWCTQGADTYCRWCNIFVP